MKSLVLRILQTSKIALKKIRTKSRTCIPKGQMGGHWYIDKKFNIFHSVRSLCHWGENIQYILCLDR